MASWEHQSWCFLFLSLLWGGVVKVRSRELTRKCVNFSAFDIRYHLYTLLPLEWLAALFFWLANLNPAVWLPVSYSFFGLKVFQLQKFPFQKFSTLIWLAGNSPKEFPSGTTKKIYIQCYIYVIIYIYHMILYHGICILIAVSYPL